MVYPNHNPVFEQYPHNDRFQMKSDSHPSGSVPSVEKLEKNLNALIQERSQKNNEYKAVKQKSDDLSKARRELEAYLKNEHEVSQLKRKKRNDIE